MAIFVVALGSAAATSLIIDALTSNGLNRDNLIAMNLAVEGTEAVRNIRDGNWLKFGYDKENCWNMQADFNTCQDEDLIAQGNFTAYLDTVTMKWSLSQQSGNALDLNNAIGNDPYRLDFIDLYSAIDGDGDNNSTNDRDLYVPSGTSGTVSQSRFYRMVTIAYPTPDPTVDQEMTVTSLVQWKARGVHQVKLVTKLTNYNKVKR